MALAKPCSGSVLSGSLGISETQVQGQLLATGRAKFEQTALSLDREAWFAVFTSSHHEKKVSHRFLEQHLENFLPLYSEIHHWTNRRKVTVQLPLFPNYVFVRIDRRQRGQVLQVPGVLAIVGRGYEPTPLPDFEIESLRSGLHLRKFEPHPSLRKVHEDGGGLQGFLVRKKNNLRVVLTVPLIDKSVAVEVDAGDIEPASRHSAGVSSDPRAFQH